MQRSSPETGDPGTTGSSHATAQEAWRSALEALAIPPEILSQAPEDPWQFPRDLFVVEDGVDLPSTPSRDRAAEALPPRGSVLDVGCGGGRASLALVPPAAELTGVDESGEMLTEYCRAAGARGVAAVAVRGRWPDVTAQESIRPADVVVCHNVAYNVPDLAPFVTALTSFARERVVLEMADRHPRAGLAKLWREIWGLDRTDGPDANDAAAVAREAGFDIATDSYVLPPGPAAIASRPSRWYAGTSASARSVTSRSTGSCRPSTTRAAGPSPASGGRGPPRTEPASTAEPRAAAPPAGSISASHPVAPY